MSDCSQPETVPPEDIATLLRQQFEDSHAFIRRNFELAREGHGSAIELNLSVRLIQASASLANALKRLERQDAAAPAM